MTTTDKRAIRLALHTPVHDGLSLAAGNDAVGRGGAFGVVSEQLDRLDAAGFVIVSKADAQAAARLINSLTASGHCLHSIDPDLARRLDVDLA